MLIFRKTIVVEFKVELLPFVCFIFLLMLLLVKVSVKVFAKLFAKVFAVAFVAVCGVISFQLTFLIQMCWKFFTDHS